jgi:hypothetical protein
MDFFQLAKIGIARQCPCQLAFVLGRVLVADQRVGLANRKGSTPSSRFPAQQLLVHLMVFASAFEQSLVQTTQTILLQILLVLH